MNVYIGSDHGGYDQKAFLTERLETLGFDVKDMGSHTVDATDDYPDFAEAVSRAVQNEAGSMGILLCRSGEGMEITANKFKGIRASLVWRPDIAVETRRDNDSNVLVLPSDFVSDHDAFAVAEAFLITPFSNEERHIRRLDKIRAIETQ